MKRNIILIGILAMFFIAITSCSKKEGPAGPTGIAGLTGENGADGAKGKNNLTLAGSAVGYVQLYDINGNQLASSEGVTVAAEGTTYTTTTTADGKFTLADVATGTYTIIFSKANYGTFKVVGVPFVGGTVNTLIGEARLQPAVDPTATITNFTVGLNSTGDYLVLNMKLIKGTAALTTNYTNANTTFVYFTSRTADVSCSKYDYLGTVPMTWPEDGTGAAKIVTDVNFSYGPSEFFPSGTPIYVVAYASNMINPLGRNGYMGIDGNYIPTNIGSTPSLVKVAVIP